MFQRHSITFIHPVHAAFPFVDLSHSSISVQRFLDLLDALELDDRLQIVDSVCPLLGLQASSNACEPDQKMLQCRLFNEACSRLDLHESIALRGIVQHILNAHFQMAWPATSQQLASSSHSEQCELVSCKLTDFNRNERELWESRTRDSWMRIEAHRLYHLFCERVAGPLIGYG